MDDSDSDDSILLQAKAGLRSRPKRSNNNSSFSMKNILKESEKMVMAKSNSVQKIHRVNQDCPQEEVDDSEMERMKTICQNHGKEAEEEEALPPGFDGSCSLEDYKLMLENIELEGSHFDGKIETPFEFLPVAGLFFQSKAQAVEALEDLIHVETELNERLRAVKARDCLFQFLDSPRFCQMLGATPMDGTVCLWDWLLKVACSTGARDMQQLGCAAHRVLLSQTSTHGIETSTALLRYLNSWVPVQGPASPSSENSSEESSKPTANVAGLQSLIAIAGKTLAVVEVADVQSCLLSLLRFELCDLCSVSALLERIVALAQEKATNRDWIQPIVSNICSEINGWGEKDSSGAWMSLVAVTKMFNFSSFDSEHYAFAVASALKVVQMCLSVEKLEGGDIVKTTENNADQIFTLLSQDMADNPLIVAVYAAATGLRQFEDLANDAPRCQAMVECIVRLFHLGFFGERSETGAELVSAKNSAVVFDYTSLLIPIVEKISSEVSKRNTVTEFQRSDMSLRLLLRYLKILQDKAEAKRVTPRSQAKMSSFFAPKVAASGSPPS